MKSAKHRIAILAMHGVIPFDLATASGVFGSMVDAGYPDAYQVRVCGEARDVKAGAFDLRLGSTFDDVGSAQTIIVPGVSDLEHPISERLLTVVQAAAARGARIASICTGAFVLAEAGILDGRRATTHWAAAKELSRRYPEVSVDPNVLFIDEGNVLTSAGAAAGLDLCLHIVARDYGASAASSAARLAVMPMRRDGGQAQFIAHSPIAVQGELGPVLAWMDDHAQESPSLEQIASHAAMSVRTLSRRFKSLTGTTPVQWMLEARVRRAQILLETTSLSVSQIATQAGFESATTFRDMFSKRLRTTPSAYRQALGAAVQR